MLPKQYSKRAEIPEQPHFLLLHNPTASLRRVKAEHLRADLSNLLREATDTETTSLGSYDKLP